MELELLEPKDRAWVLFHLKLATTREYDFARFSDLFLAEIEEPKPVKVEPVKPKAKPKARKRGRLSYNGCYSHYDDADADEWYDAESRRADLEQAELLKYCRNATREEYQEWLTGYLRKGGKVTHPREGKFRYGSIKVLVAKPAYIPELYGANSVDIIVPKNVDLHPNELRRTFHGVSGHNSIFFMRDFVAVSGWVESFADVR